MVYIPFRAPSTGPKNGLQNILYIHSRAQHNIQGAAERNFFKTYRSQFSDFEKSGEVLGIGTDIKEGANKVVQQYRYR